jgi:hypothetical protein
MTSMMAARRKPPRMTEARRDQRSARRTAGMVVAKMTTAERPEARNEEDSLTRPACWNRRGAYCVR